MRSIALPAYAAVALSLAACSGGGSPSAPLPVVAAHLAVNPSSRTGYVNGPSVNQLQELPAAKSSDLLYAR